MEFLSSLMEIIDKLKLKFFARVEKQQEILEQLIMLKKIHKYLSGEVVSVNKRIMLLEALISDQLIENNQIKTGEYDSSIGTIHATLGKSRLFANVNAANKEKLFDYLKSIDADSLIKTKTDVHPGTLSSLVSKLLEEGKAIPEFINFYEKQNILTYVK